MFLLTIETPQKPDMERLMTEYGDQLLRLSFLYLHDLHLAEDAVQDTFLKVHKSWSGFSGRSSERTWIMRIAINTCKNYLRGAWMRRVDVKEALAEIPSPENVETETDDTLIREIMKLPPKSREAVLLYYYPQFKTAEIAEILHLPEATVSTRLSRARQKLRDALKGWYYDE